METLLTLNLIENNLGQDPESFTIEILTEKDEHVATIRYDYLEYSTSISVSGFDPSKTPGVFDANHLAALATTRLYREFSDRDELIVDLFDRGDPILDLHWEKNRS